MTLGKQGDGVSGAESAPGVRAPDTGAAAKLDREAVARIIDPRSFDEAERWGDEPSFNVPRSAIEEVKWCVSRALAKADAIIVLTGARVRELEGKAEAFADVALRNAQVISAHEPARRLLAAAGEGPRADLDVLRGLAESREQLFDNASAVARKSAFGAATAAEASSQSDALRTAIVEIEAYRKAAEWQSRATAERSDRTREALESTPKTTGTQP